MGIYLLLLPLLLLLVRWSDGWHLAFSVKILKCITHTYTLALPNARACACSVYTDCTKCRMQNAECIFTCYNNSSIVLHSEFTIHNSHSHRIYFAKFLYLGDVILQCTHRMVDLLRMFAIWMNMCHICVHFRLLLCYTTYIRFCVYWASRHYTAVVVHCLVVFHPTGNCHSNG